MILSVPRNVVVTIIADVPWLVADGHHLGPTRTGLYPGKPKLEFGGLMRPEP